MEKFLTTDLIFIEDRSAHANIERQLLNGLVSDENNGLLERISITDLVKNTRVNRRVEWTPFLRQSVNP